MAKKKKKPVCYEGEPCNSGAKIVVQFCPEAGATDFSFIKHKNESGGQA